MNWAVFFSVLCMIESSGNPDAVGDKRLRNRAYGIAQVRQGYLKDVVANEGRKMQKEFGRKLTLDDMKDPEKAEWVVRAYLEHYGDVYTKETGKEPTPEVLSRIHNGGPLGWKKKTTDAYWKKFSKEWDRQVSKNGQVVAKL